MPEFDILRLNEDLAKRAIQLRKPNIDPDTLGTVAIGIIKTVMIHQKKKYKNWVKYMRKDLPFVK